MAVSVVDDRVVVEITVPTTTPNPGVPDPWGLNFSGSAALRNLTDQSMGFGSVFSIQQNLDPDFDAYDAVSLQIWTEGGSNENFISISFESLTGFQDPIRVIITDDFGDPAKDFTWELAASNSHASLGPPISLVIVFDETEYPADKTGMLKCYVNGVIMPGPADSPDNSRWPPIDTPPRRIAIGARDDGSDGWIGNIHSTSIWNVALTPDEIAAMYNDGSPEDFDNRFDWGDYTSSANLMHYWRHGSNALDVGEDLGNAATLIDVDVDAVNISSSDIVVY